MITSGIYKFFREARIFALILLVLWVIGVLYAISPIIEDYRFITLHKILKAGQMTVITRNTPHCYYLYRGEAMGFEYELAREFADYLGVELKVKIVDN
jgi:membrane-bound lytic murein transglycosylase F